MIETGFMIGLGIFLAMGVVSLLPLLLVLVWAFRWPLAFVGAGVLLWLITAGHVL